MNEDQYAAAEKILLDIEMVFKRDPKLKEFDILPVKLNQNKSPVIHAEHCLGLESWCVRHVYCYCYRHIMDEKQSRRRRDTTRREDPAVKARWLLGAALLNPENPAFWHGRKQLVQSGRLEPGAELRLAAVALSRRPKCAEVFAQRRWLLQHMMGGQPAMQASAVSELVELELEVSEACASRHANNYHAWLHRAWVLSDLAPHSADPAKVILSEWARSEVWVGSHVSDGSGLRFRQLLIGLLPTALASPTTSPLASETMQIVRQRLAGYLDDKRYEVVVPLSLAALPVALCGAELSANAELIHLFEGHEALWSHRRATLMALQDAFKKMSTDAEDEVTAAVRCTVQRVEAALVTLCSGSQPYVRSLAAHHDSWLRAVLRMDTAQ